jgi:hypothetical protein
MQPFIHIVHFRPAFDELFDNINLVACPGFKPLGIVSNHCIVPCELDLPFDIVDAPLLHTTISESISDSERQTLWLTAVLGWSNLQTEP